MSENWVIQVSPKLGDTLVNIRAASTEEFKGLLLWAKDNATDIVATVDALKGVANIAQAIPGSTVVADKPAYERQGSPAYFPPKRAAPQAQAPSGPAPTCAHGQRTYAERPKKDGSGTFRVWNCPLNWKDPAACKPQYV